MNKLKIIIVITVTLLCPARLFSQTNYFVSSHGSDTGMDDTRGLLVISIIPGHKAAFLQANDVIISLNGEPKNSLKDLQKARMSVIGTSTEIVIFRNQHAVTKRVEFDNYK